MAVDTALAMPFSLSLSHFTTSTVLSTSCSLSYYSSSSNFIAQLACLPHLAAFPPPLSPIQHHTTIPSSSSSPSLGLAATPIVFAACLPPPACPSFSFALHSIFILLSSLLSRSNPIIVIVVPHPVGLPLSLVASTTSTAIPPTTTLS